MGGDGGGAGRVAALFAEILEYPGPGLEEAARECAAELAREGLGEAAALLRGFRDALAATPPERWEETYTVTFDLDGTCCPYVGHHLFGESYKRSVFLLQLKARYREHGFVPPGCELPDHLAVMLGFLAARPEADLSRDLMADALGPALRAMEKEAAEDPAGRSPYHQVLGALARYLEASAPAGAAAMHPGGSQDV